MIYDMYIYYIEYIYIHNISYIYIYNIYIIYIHNNPLESNWESNWDISYIYIYIIYLVGGLSGCLFSIYKTTTNQI